MAQTLSEPRGIIVGCGVAGISLAAKLKSQLDFHNFTIYERERSLRGTWYLNTYPGVGCDVDSHLYSFSFNLNPNWSKRFAEQPEIYDYLNHTVDKFGIRPHIRCGVEIIEARWDEARSVWRVHLHDLDTSKTFWRESEILISYVGTITTPKGLVGDATSNRLSGTVGVVCWEQAAAIGTARVCCFLITGREVDLFSVIFFAASAASGHSRGL